MTEDGAKTKYCCGVLSKIDFDIRHANGETDIKAMKCQGSKCMAWRWEAGAFDHNGTPSVRNFQGDVVQAHGHCGLAGRP
jgi:hypothetical protein